ncbi:MAG TPA: response regulator [Vicinamibacterales bacterium]|nr:response regulator [Vicinamibacterales bacterium]
MARPRIVVADDHDKTRAAIASLLASDFDVVSTVADGQAAVEAAGALYPDLVVLDISMHGLNGFEAAALIRDLPDPPRIVFATTYEDASIAGAASALGASAVVRKRQMLTELVPAVRRALLFHAVCFYEDSLSLAGTVARFIGEGLVASQAAVIVATASHSAFIRDQLTAMGVDCQQRIEHGELMMFDADEVLNRLMVGKRPDAECFEDTINPIVDKAAGGRKRLVRIYGEMVDVLWSSGREDAALSLEILWHQLIAGRKCLLLCGYASGVCQTEGFNAICDRHSHVMPPHTAV